jgi:catechol 2,3-dioxygenase-like lactoylglutathione lyase family enzyme
MSAITHLFAGVPVSDLDASIDWYARFFGRPPDSRVGDEILWEIDERAWLFIEPNAARAGAGRITLAVAGLDALLERLAAQRIEHEPIETYSSGVRHVKIPDPYGNAIAFAEPPDAASASGA